MPQFISIECGVTPWAFAIQPTTIWLWSGTIVATTVWAKAMGLIYYDWFADRSAWRDSLRLMVGSLLVLGLNFTIFRSSTAIYSSVVSLVGVDYANLKWLIHQRKAKAINHDLLGQLKVVEHQPMLYQALSKIVIMINLFALIAAIIGTFLLLFFMSFFAR
ncbi:hypothetical protein [Herpetosiphon giganteus]|uniref:hypothetical protein n=1 Tax=Herpetosiphon giganteus TaxID=2029754 RepID=UPI0019584044|nr:hypothetical protein [Herpetosiphon giganteus]MBM7843730.1 cytochrome b [Herpetosiphon giganteus]